MTGRLAFCALCPLIGWTAGCSDDAHAERSSEHLRSRDYWVIDADVPGTEIYLRGRLLGMVPFTLTRDCVASLGLRAPRNELEMDGWGGGIRLREPDEREVELSFRVPDEAAAYYRTVETPWGRRTGTSGAYSNRDVWTAQLARTASDGLTLTVTVPEVHVDLNQPVECELRAEHSAAEMIEGSDPYIFVLWGTYHVPWRRRNMLEIELPEYWCRFTPGEVKDTVLQFTAPNVNEHFSVLVVFGLHESADPHDLMLTVYSNTEMFQTRYPNCPPRCSGGEGARQPPAGASPPAP